jgi:hypothetical protein
MTAIRYYQRCNIDLSATRYMRAKGEHAVKIGGLYERIGNQANLGQQAPNIALNWGSVYSSPSGYSATGDHRRHRVCEKGSQVCGEVYDIGNPGEGINVHPIEGAPAVPRVLNVYDSVELVARKRYSNRWQATAHSRRPIVFLRCPSLDPPAAPRQALFARRPSLSWPASPPTPTASTGYSCSTSRRSPRALTCVISGRASRPRALRPTPRSPDLPSRRANRFASGRRPSHTIRHMLIAALFLWLLAQPDSAPKPIETAHLSLVLSRRPETVTPGGKVTLQIDVTPKPKMHVYAPGQEGYIPIALTLTADSGFTAAKAKYPAGEKYVMPAINETQIVYARPFRITQEITLQRSVSGTATIKGTVRYQACDDAICYLPKTVPVEWTLTVVR